MTFEPYLGIPFVKGGRARHPGLDCWGLVCLFYAAELGVLLSEHAAPLGQLTPRLETRTEELASGSWKETCTPGDGDAVGLGTSAGLSHVGIYLCVNGEPSVLHAYTSASIIQPLRFLMQHGFPVIKFYRHANRS